MAFFYYEVNQLYSTYFPKKFNFINLKIFYINFKRFKMFNIVKRSS